MSNEHGGYMGKILYVDLSNRKIFQETPDEKIYKDYIGGYGLGSRIIYSHQKAKVDPLGPENILGFVTGPLTGTPAISGARYAVVGKSPLTETWGDANAGGYMGTAIKKAGYDAIFFFGISEGPVYLFINNGNAELKDASNLWGKDAAETEKLLKAKVGKKTGIASIGQAGENLSLISGIINDGGRICARSGLGAVMGAKKLKAVVVTGNTKIPVRDADSANNLRKKYLSELKEDLIYQLLNKFGTCAFTVGSIRSDDTGVKNWNESAETHYKINPALIDGEYITQYQITKYGCYRCPIACGGIVKIHKGDYRIEEAHKPEYETLAVFGPMCLNVNTEAIIKLNYLCNIYGLDTLSTGGTIAFAMECYEKGIITKKDTGGIDLAWGNSEAMIKIVELMAKRQGFGDILADGTRIAAEKIGGGSEKYAMNIHGQEFPMHGAINAPGYVVPWTMDATPGRHTKGGYSFLERYGTFMKGLDLPQEIDKYDYRDRGEWAAKMHNIMHIVDSAGLCLFAYVALDFQSIPDFMKSIIGWEYSLNDLYKIGERISNMRQSFNIREGLNPINFKLPDRVIGKPPLKAGPLAGITVDSDTQIKDFLMAHDWALETAKPSKNKLLELGLEDVAKDLYPG